MATGADAMNRQWPSRHGPGCFCQWSARPGRSHLRASLPPRVRFNAIRRQSRWSMICRGGLLPVVGRDRPVASTEEILHPSPLRLVGRGLDVRGLGSSFWLMEPKLMVTILPVRTSSPVEIVSMRMNSSSVELVRGNHTRIYHRSIPSERSNSAYPRCANWTGLRKTAISRSSIRRRYCARGGSGRVSPEVMSDSKVGFPSPRRELFALSPTRC